MIRYQITESAALAVSDAHFIQVRAPGIDARQLAALVRAMPAGPRILVNDRADVALVCGAAGVHLRAGSVSPATIRKLGPLMVTVACHSEEEVLMAEGADYALLSPIFRPLSKADAREPLGLAGLQRLARLSPVPLIALGGITEENTAACLTAGAAGVAGITLFRAPLRERQQRS